MFGNIIIQSLQIVSVDVRMTNASCISFLGYCSRSSNFIKTRWVQQVLEQSGHLDIIQYFSILDLFCNMYVKLFFVSDLCKVI